MSASLVAHPIVDLLRSLRAGRVLPGELVRSAGDAQSIADAGPDPIHAFLATDFEAASLEADALARAGGLDLPLAGIPVAVKDNILTVGLPTTCGSRTMEGYRSPYEATAVRLLRQAGALVVGKTNLDEFAMGSSTEHSAFGPTRNPHDRSRVPGGSSGGSAAAVAAGIVPAALGSETGGSVRQPAAFCGVVGLKPTHGRVSRYGLVAFASSLDQIGVLGRTVDDAAHVLEVISGRDPLDSTSRALPPPAPAAVPDGLLEGIVIGVPEEYFPYGLDRRVAEACRATLRRLEGLGAELREISLPNTSYAVPAYYVIAPAEASSNLARFDGTRFGRRAEAVRSLEELWERSRALFGPEVRRRIMLGTFVLSAGHFDAYYARAQRVRERVAEDFHLVFRSGVDVIFTPTTPSLAFRFGEHLGDPYQMYLADAFTIPASLAGLPALSLPIAGADGLPVGGQLIGRAWAEANLTRVAGVLERALARSDRGEP